MAGDDQSLRFAALGAFPALFLFTLLTVRMLWTLLGEEERIDADIMQALPPPPPPPPPLQPQQQQRGAADRAPGAVTAAPEAAPAAPAGAAPPAGRSAIGMGLAEAAASAAAPPREAGCAAGAPEGCWGPPAPPPQAPPAEGGDKLYAFTSLTGPHLHYCATLASAALSGLELDIVGWRGEKGRSEWRGKAFNLTWKKIVQAERVAGAVAALDPWTVVLYTDGGDTVVTAPSAAAVLSAFRRWEMRTGRRFLLSAEVNCYMRTLPKDGCKHSSYPWRSETYAYPNTGVWMARAFAAHWFFRGVRRFAEARHPDGTRRLDDQAMIGEALAVVPVTASVVGLDHRVEVIQNLFLAWEPWHFCYTRGGGLRNIRTGSSPVIWHANGPKLFYSPQKGLGILSEILKRGAPWPRRGLPRFSHPAAASQQEACAPQWQRMAHPPKFPARKFKPILRCSQT
eukprot:TRINITY_DN3543_c1_g1_i4.p1 TRINITY_DN3543_c1_g1~~TRINITY_DN3543_c1_g1_i4.p1  ORF type:complete len:491 (+),score=147.88 TRINITY_DN3543_c1_g1_i4:114-1475(+)